MGRINILDEESANMIAAGEVVDRPSSALKELIENSVDAKAKNIAVYLKNGGNTRIRVSDDGEGMLREDLPKALYRHATSKIKNGYEIDGVKTLGFRGEALAAASAVSRMEIISKTADEKMGSRLSSNETGVELYETGCPDGTTVTVDDLFYNVPARRKFMKKDASEASACFAVCEKLALGHPEVSLSVYSDDVLKFRTSGDGKLYSAIYAIYGSQTAKSFEKVDYELEGVRVEGYVSRPDSPRGTRNMQTFFINSRYIKSKTVQAALEEAYRSYIPSGKFPAAVLNIIIDYNDVDVNVHPAKTEVKFADEKKVFSAVYYGIKFALNPKTEEKKPAAEQPASKPVMEFHNEKPITTGYGVFTASSADSELPPLVKNNSPEAEVRRPAPIIYGFPTENTPPTVKAAQQSEQPNSAPSKINATQETLSSVLEFTILGEAYDAYIFAQLKDRVIIVDKHAAHERILYENLRNRKTVSPQTLLFPVTITLSPSESETLLANAEYLKGFGFVIDEFGPSTVAVREVPAALRNTDGLAQILESFAKDLAGNYAVSFEDKVDRALYTMACKAALKAGQLSTERDAEYIIENILRLNLKYCPHGRPFVKEISKREIEKYFDR